MTAALILATTAAVISWLVASGGRSRAAAGAATLVLAPATLLVSATGDAEASLPALSLPLAAALGLTGAAALAIVGAAFVRWPVAIVPAALATLPFRVPLTVGGESVKLLLPLYLVIGGAIAACVWRSRGAGDAPRRSPRWLDIAIAVFLGLYALQALYSPDIDVAAQNIAFFYAPFALLYGIAARERWTAAGLRASVAVLVGVALLLVCAGFVEFARGEYLVKPGGIAANDFDPYFRVQSLFFDPNIFGRFLALVMIVLAAVLLFTSRPARVLGAALGLAVLWAGLVLTLSQSSFAALLAGLLALACLRWRAKVVLVSSGLLLLLVAGLVLAFPSVSGVDVSSERDAERSTSGRFDLLSGGLRLWGERPLWGHGSGGFAAEFERNRLASDSAFGSPSTTKSHTAPLTVAAEQGVIGLAAFLWMLATAFQAVYRRAWPGPRPGAVGRIAVAAAFTAIFVHSLAYAALLEDPLTWTMLGVAVSLGAVPRVGGSPA